MSYIDIPIRKSLSELGLNQFGQSPLQFTGSEVNLKSQTMFEAGLPSNFIMDGDIIHRLNVIDGYLQSNNYLAGTSGWRIDSDGNIYGNNGEFRGNITGATGAFSGTMGWSGIQSGTNSNVLNIGNGYVYIDGGNKRIIINDGTNDRILIGYASGKF